MKKIIIPFMLSASVLVAPNAFADPNGVCWRTVGLCKHADEKKVSSAFVPAKLVTQAASNVVAKAVKTAAKELLNLKK